MNTSEVPDLKIIIQGKFPSLNEFINASRRNKFASNKMKQLWTTTSAAYANSQRKGISFDRAYFSFLWFEQNKKRDLDNIAFSKKFIFDGFVKAGLIPNDGWLNVEGFDDNFTIDKQNPRVEISIWER